MLKNPNPQKPFELPGGVFRKFEVVFLIPSMPPLVVDDNNREDKGKNAYLACLLYETVEDYHAGKILTDVALGWFYCDPNSALMPAANKFALETFEGFQVVDKLPKAEE